jgi:tocopherol O-methyltransferase
MLDLIGLSPRRHFPPGGEELYRQIALLTDMEEHDEVLDVACRRGVSLEYFVRENGVHGSGVDEDPNAIQQAEERAREAGLAGQLQFQAGPSEALPYRDEIFDVAVGELGLAAHCDPGAAVKELVRVTKPGGYIVLVQLVWKAPVDEVRQRVLAEHLGTRPLMLVEWKRRLKDLGVSEVHTEDWSDEETSFRSSVVKPFPDFAEIFSFWEKIGIMRRAWGRWGGRGVRTVLEREYEVHRLLTRDRILGLYLMKGRTPVGSDSSSTGASERTGAGRVEVASAESPAPVVAPSGPSHTETAEEEHTGDAEEEHEDTAGLPLFEGDGTTR